MEALKTALLKDFHLFAAGCAMDCGGCPESAGARDAWSAHDMTRKLPNDRQPFDPAKAARERNALAATVHKPTEPQRVVRKPGLRPLLVTPRPGAED